MDLFFSPFPTSTDIEAFRRYSGFPMNFGFPFFSLRNFSFYLGALNPCLFFSSFDVIFSTFPSSIPLCPFDCPSLVLIFPSCVVFVEVYAS